MLSASLAWCVLLPSRDEASKRSLLCAAYRSPKLSVDLFGVLSPNDHVALADYAVLAEPAGALSSLVVPDLVLKVACIAAGAPRGRRASRKTGLNPDTYMRPQWGTRTARRELSRQGAPSLPEAPMPEPPDLDTEWCLR